MAREPIWPSSALSRQWLYEALLLEAAQRSVQRARSKTTSAKGLNVEQHGVAVLGSVCQADEQ